MRARAILAVARLPIVKCLLIASAFGWVALVWQMRVDVAHPATMAGHTAHPPAHFAASWLAMIVAMTPPLLIREIASVWNSGLRRTRYLTVASFVIGYAAVWLVAGQVMAMLLALMIIDTDSIAAAVAVAIVWHGSPARQRRLNACHRVPALRVFGAPAQRDSLIYGVRSGGNCLAACFPIMLLAFLATNYHFALMAAAAVLMTIERYSPPQPPRWRFGIARRERHDWPSLEIA